MGHKSRRKVKLQQRNKRHKKRLKLAKDKQKPEEFFYGNTWVGSRKGSTEA